MDVPRRHDGDRGYDGLGDHNGQHVRPLDYVQMIACTATGCDAKSLRNSQLCMAHVKRKSEIGREIRGISENSSVDWQKLREAALEALERWGHDPKRSSETEGIKWRVWDNGPYPVVIHQTAVPIKRDTWDETLNRYKLGHQRTHWSRPLDTGYPIPAAWTSGYHYAYKSKVKK